MDGYLTIELSLLSWVPLCILAFGTLRPQYAALFAFLGGMLILPERRAFDFVGLPPIGKMEIASLGALAGCILFRNQELRRAGPFRGLEMLVLLTIPFCLATVMLNRDPTGDLGLFPGLRPWDAAGLVFQDLLLLGAPVWIGRSLFRTSSHLHLLLLTLVAAALAYSVLILFEVRMSPQLNNYVYGFSQHSWAQVRRFGGWRPMVFMAHGLALGVFVCAALIAALGVHRARLRVLGLPAVGAAGYLAVVLLLCKSLASILYAGFLAPVLLFARPRALALGAAVIATLVLAYPAMRAADVFPTTSLLEAAAAVSEERADSLETRFENEDGLLQRARERIWFGWGGFGRSRYSEDRATGWITDGYWILRLGERGIAGLAVYFALMLWPIAQTLRALPYTRRRDAFLLGALTLVVAMQTVDTVPNALFNNFPLLLAGALSGLARGLPAEARAARRDAKGEPGAAAPKAEEVAEPASTTADLARGRVGSARRAARGRGATPGSSR